MYKVILFSFLLSTSCGYACFRNEYVEPNGKFASYKADLYPILRTGEENNVLAHAAEVPEYNLDQVEKLAQLRRALKVSGE